MIRDLWSWPCVVAVAIAPSLASGATSAPFKEMRDYLGALSDGSQDRWFASLRSLAQSFDGVCGDTFCEGDYSDMQALGFYCVVSNKGVVGRCKWVFAGSYAVVSAKTGALGLHRRMFTCDIPLANGTSAGQLVDALDVAGSGDPINRPLPGTNGSVYDALVNCLH